MKIFKLVISFISVVICTFSFSNIAVAKEWPQKKITLIVPYAAGGTTDILSRRFAELLQKELDNPVIVENRPGAGSTIATGQLAREKRNVDYTIVMASPGHTVNASIYSSLPYDPVNDFKFLSNIIIIPNVMVVPQNSPYNSVSEFIEAAKNKSLSFSSPGIGSSVHMSGELFKSMTQSDKMVHIPYRGSGEALPALLSGDVDVSFENLPTVNSLIKSNQVKALAVTTKTRSTWFPDLPTLDEIGDDYGLDGFNTSAWFGLIANKNMSNDASEKLIEAIENVKNSKEFNDFLPTIGAEKATEIGDDFKTMIAEDIDKWAVLVKQVGISK